MLAEMYADVNSYGIQIMHRTWQIPGHALHEKGLQRQKGVGPLVSSQEQRALLVPRLHRSSTGRCVPPSVYIGFRLFVLLERRSVQQTCLRCLGGYVGRLSPWRTVLSASRPAQPRTAAPPCAPTRPARGMSGSWTRQVILLDNAPDVQNKTQDCQSYAIRYHPTFTCIASGNNRTVTVGVLMYANANNMYFTNHAAIRPDT